MLKSAFAVMLLCAGLLASPRLVPSAYASFGGCTVTCTNGVCSANPDPGETCQCVCTFLTSSAKCVCTEALRPETPG